MTPDERRDIRVVVHAEDPAGGSRTEGKVRLPINAKLGDLLHELEQVSPELHAEVRRRVLKASSRVLAYGKDDTFLPLIARQLVSGGPVVIPSEQEDEETDPVSDTQQANV